MTPPALEQPTTPYLDAVVAYGSRGSTPMPPAASSPCTAELVGRPGVAAWDPLRLVVDVRGTGVTGYEIATALRTSYDIHLELATPPPCATRSSSPPARRSSGPTRRCWQSRRWGGSRGARLHGASDPAVRTLDVLAA